MAKPAKNAITGEPQEDIKTVIERPPACPNCGSWKRTQFEGVRSIDAEIEIDGITFTRVSWSLTNCKDCGTRYRVKKYGFKPKDNSGNDLIRPSQLIGPPPVDSIGPHEITSGT